jgi:predicted Zn-dependent protease
MHLETAVRIEPEMGEAWYHLAQVEKSLGKSAEARTALERFQGLRAQEQDERQQMLRSMQEGLGIKK